MAKNKSPRNDLIAILESQDYWHDKVCNAVLKLDPKIPEERKALERAMNSSSQHFMVQISASEKLGF
jgi:hypothetical protein